jgi:two-component system response regulator YesN
LADDEPWIRRDLETLIDWERCGFYIVAQCGNGVEALERVRTHNPHLIIVDIKMPLLDGFAFLESLRKSNGAAVVVILSAYSHYEYMRRAIANGAFDYLLKPVEEETLVDVLRRAKEKLDVLESGKRVTDNDVVNDIIDYINRKYSEEITVEYFARKYFLSSKYLSRLFKNKMRVNFMTYLINVRLEKAVDMMENTSLNLHEISERVGYENYVHFSRIFKKYKGYPPREHKKGKQ